MLPAYPPPFPYWISGYLVKSTRGEWHSGVVAPGCFLLLEKSMHRGYNMLNERAES